MFKDDDFSRSQSSTPLGDSYRWANSTALLDTVQDHPASWDWRLVLGFVFAGATALYWL